MSLKSFVHPSAIVHPSATLGENCYVGPFCLIGPHVKIGNGNRLEAYVSIGTAAEHRNYFLSEPGAVEIGDNNIFREFVTVNAGTERSTTVGNDVVMLRGSHLGHDAVLRDKVNVSCNVMVGGHSIIGYGANLGLASVIHQNRCVGAFAMVGMNSTVTRNGMPFAISYGAPCEPQRLNRIGLQRAGVTPLQLQIFEDWFQMSKEKTEPNEQLRHEFSKYLRQYTEDCAVFDHRPEVLAITG
jgi:UDP-N-acetylglucosamine acyltransferase